MFDTREIPAGFFGARLAGPRLLLLPYDEKRDFDEVAAMLSDPRVAQPAGITFSRFAKEQLREMKRLRADSCDAGEWTLFAPHDEQQKEPGRFAGEAGISRWDIETRVAEFFVLVCSDCAGLAYGREALSVLMGHLFSHDELAVARAETLMSNTRALAACLSLGFRQTGSRFLVPDSARGFRGGIAAILDCHKHEFRPFQITQRQQSTTDSD